MSRPERPLSAPPTRSAGATAALFLFLVAFSPSVAGSTWSPRAAVLLLLGALGLVPLVHAARHKEAIPALLLGWAAWAATSGLTSPQPALATVGLHNWGTGWLFVLAAAGAWAVGRETGATTASRFRTSFLLGVGVNAVVGVVQWSQLIDVFPFELSEGRSSGLLGNPLHLGALCGAALILLASGDRLVAVVAFPSAALYGTGVALSGSRSSLALLGAAVLVASLRQRWIPLALLATGLVVGLSVGAIWSGPTSSENVTAGDRALSSGGSIEARTGMWVTGAGVAVDDPLTGAGPGRFRAATAARRPLSVARAEGPDRLFVDAHNIVVEYLVTTGVPGVIAVLAAIILAFRRARGEWLGCALMLGGAHLTSPQSVATTPLFFLALGLAHPRRPSHLPFGRRHRAIQVAACGAAVAAGALLLRGDFLLNEARLDVELPDALAAERILPPWPEPARRVAIAYAFRARAENNPDDERLSIHWFEEAARRAPDDAAAWSDFADRHLQNGNAAAAEAAYRRALRSNPFSTRALNGLARALRADGRSVEARATLEKSLFIDPDQATVRKALEHWRADSEREDAGPEGPASSAFVAR